MSSLTLVLQKSYSQQILTTIYTKAGIICASKLYVKFFRILVDKVNKFHSKLTWKKRIVDAVIYTPLFLTVFLVY